ncbi:MAG: hypothetical protein HYZ33_00265, partial [Ignavibacteriales bacterium]|nr:hypothetical protein [Ignavibacteriales bacterium]
MLSLMLNTSSYGQLLPFQYYTTREGLASNWTTDILQDSRGYIWIGTATGLSRFDGIEFRTFTTKDGLPNDYVNTVIESRAEVGVLWIATNDGLSKFKDGHFSNFYIETSSESEKMMLSLHEDVQGTIWIGTYFGVYRLMKNECVRFVKENQQIGYFGIEETKDGLWWAGTRQGLRFRNSAGEKFVPFLHDDTPQSPVVNLFKDSEDNIWVASEDSTIAKIHRGKLVSSLKIPFGIPTRMLEEDDEHLLVSVAERGVYRVAKSDQKVNDIALIIQANTIGIGSLLPILKDREHNLWFLNPNRGILKLTDMSIVSFPMIVVAHSINNSGMALDVNNHCWIANGTQITEVWADTQGEWHQFNHQNVTDGTDFYQAVCSDSKGQLWFKTRDYHLFCFAGQLLSEGHSQLTRLRTLVPNIDFSATTGIMCFMVDRNERCWISIVNTGVAVINLQNLRSKIILIDSTRGWYNGGPRVLYQDNKGNLWFGGNDAGLGFLPKDSVTHGKIKLYTTADGLPNNFIRSLAEDSLGNLWIGTRYGGVAKYRNGKFTMLPDENKLLGNGVWCIAVSPDSSVWFGTNDGVYWIEHPDSTTIYQKPELKGESVSALRVQENGSVWIMTTNGLKIFDPKNRNSNI